MNIKQAERESGVASANIRFYEKQGLLHPARNPENDYRDYSADDLRSLKLIRALRMLDMPLDEIRRVQDGTLPLPDAAAEQKQRLEAQAKELEGAIRLCDRLRQSGAEPATLDLDDLLASADVAEESCYTGWLYDYRRTAAHAHKIQFVFYPDGPVRNAREMTAALFDYAAQNDLDLTITQEGTTPRFLLDGAEYRACRRYANIRGIPVAAVRCEMTDPADFAPDLPPWRKNLLLALHYGWPIIAFCVFALFLLGPRGLLTSGWGWLTFLAMGAAAVSGTVYNFYYFYNADGKKGKPKK